VELLIERYTSSEANIITEQMNGGKDVFLNGRFLSGAIKNRNGRVYPVNEIANAVRTINEMIQGHGSVVGELDHPSNRLTTELKYASHVITELRMDGDHANGKLKLLATPYGEVVKELIRAGFRPDVSSRGAGNVNNEGIVEGFMIQTIDIVSQASGIGCEPVPVYEHLEDTRQGIRTLTLAEATLADVNAQKYFVKEVKKFLDEISKFNK
jgi:hypothetical protein